MCNSTKDSLGIDWIQFMQVPQLEIDFRTATKQALLSTNKMNISPNCPVLYNELLLAVWDLKSIKPKLLASCPDHMMDAFDYAMTPWYKPFYSLHFSNSYYFNSQPRFLERGKF